jgi:hypothetical protein
MKNVGFTDDRKSVGAQAALWVYAFAGLLALFPSAMTDEMSLALLLSFIVLYVVGLFVVDALGKRNRGALLASVAAAAIVVVFSFDRGGLVPLSHQLGVRRSGSAARGGVASCCRVAVGELAQ